jgi:pyruvate dehydrogenase E2 component (dihydrolipoamide acetyltransferase)
MSSKITMPRLSDTMTEGVLLKWHKKEGDVIEAGEVIAEAESDKATMELEAFDEGILKKILVPEGSKIAVGGTLAIVADEQEDISDVLAKIERASAEPSVGEEKAEITEKPIETPLEEEEPVRAAPVIDKAAPDEILATGTERIKASPLARKIAEQRGFDLRKLTGSGTAGRIIKRDIMEYASKAPTPTIRPAATLAGQELKLSTMREAIARRMTESKTQMPHFYLVMEIDMKKAIEFRKSLNEIQTDIKISYNDIIMKAAAQALLKTPMVNGSFAGDKIILHDRVDLGFAVALDEGLITPIVRNCETKSLGQIAREVRDLADRAKTRKLKPDEYTGSTFTVSNLGMYGVEEFTAIINPPEAAILAIGGIVEKPVVEEGQIVVGHRMKVTLSCDHRIVDGATGSLYLREFKKLMENPLALMM